MMYQAASDSAAHEPQQAPPPYTESNSATVSRVSTPSTSARRSHDLRRESLSPEPSAYPVDRKAPLAAPVVAAAAAGPNHALGSSDDADDDDNPPDDAQRARAPFHIARKNASLTGDWLIFTDSRQQQTGLDAAEDVPDAWLETSNSRLKANLWVADSEWKKPVTIRAKTSNSGNVLAVHTQKDEQAVQIECTTSNSSIQVQLPRGFHGVLKMTTSNGKFNISDSLKRRSVQVTPGPEESSPQAEWYEIGGPSGPSTAVLRTSNSKVTVGFVDDESLSAASSSCCMS